VLYPTTKTGPLTAELSIIEYDIFKFFPTPSTFVTGNGNEAGGIFLSGLMRLITGWLAHIMRPTRRKLRSKL
jgi:hypothetical protein